MSIARGPSCYDETSSVLDPLDAEAMRAVEAGEFIAPAVDGRTVYSVRRAMLGRSVPRHRRTHPDLDEARNFDRLMAHIERTHLGDKS